ncbi:MAG: sigma-54-dependent Fis family transcriptional regulator [Calditrichaeota bacterium]|nr:MAG: sigma-54-dependent Fis family transcriptional regulator [Calditrichota bacterium]
MHVIHILLIEDEAYDVRRVRNTLHPLRDRLHIDRVVADGVSALEYLNNNRYATDVVIMDFQISGGVTGENLIRRIKETDPAIQIIVVTKMTINMTDFKFANSLLDAGAMWYCTKYPGDIEEYIYQPTDFILSILNAYQKRRLEQKEKKSRNKLRQSIHEILERNAIIGSSDIINKLRDRIERAAAQESTVLITGESGTGKELVARNIHYRSKRKYEKIVTINCGSLPGELVDSELFGYEKGAFTGAHKNKRGFFETAANGTLFLDEIGELPLPAQVKLLRVLQEGEIDKIGRTEQLRVNVRVLAATNKNLMEEVANKHFREDLFYRLNVVTLHVPPLRERRDDIPELLDVFVARFAREMDIPVPQFLPESQEALQKYNWPGNVRQLQNVVRRLLFMTPDVVSAEMVAETLRGTNSPSVMESKLYWNEDNILPWREMERKMRKEYFSFVRKKCRSDSEAANLLGLAPPNFHRMCKELGLK